MHATEVREKLFNIRMNDEEVARLERLAAHYGLSAAGVVRMLIKREADAVDAKGPPPAPPSRPRVKSVPKK